MNDDCELFLQSDWPTNVLIWKTRGVGLFTGYQICLEILFAYGSITRPFLMP